MLLLLVVGEALRLEEVEFPTELLLLLAGVIPLLVEEVFREIVELLREAVLVFPLLETLIVALVFADGLVLLVFEALVYLEFAFEFLLLRLFVAALLPYELFLL